MRWVSYGPPGQEKPGLLVADQILCLWTASQGRLRSIGDVLRGEDALRDEINRWQQATPSGSLREAAKERLGPPLTRPGKIVCLGLNYRGHAEEQDKPIPNNPLLFCKANTSLAGPQDPIWHPLHEQHLDYEVEMGIVFGRPAFRVPPERWRDVIAGYTVINDISARDTQNIDKKWFRGKSFDTCCPMGPTIVSADEIEDPQRLPLRTWVNGELRQEGNTDDLIFDLGAIVAFCTQNITFQPGDVIATGTPSGVGIHRKPPACLQIGDTVEVEVEGVGRLTNNVIARPEGAISPYPSPW